MALALVDILRRGLETRLILHEIFWLLQSTMMWHSPIPYVLTLTLVEGLFYQLSGVEFRF